MGSRSRIAVGSVPVIAAVFLFFSCEKEPQAGPDTGTAPALEEIIITSPSSCEMTLEQGENDRIRYDLVPAEAEPELDWSSSDETVATVKNGRVYAMAPGQTVITVSAGDIKAEVRLKVTKVQVTGFTVPASLSVWMDTGQMQELKVEVVPEKLNATSLSWKSDHPEIAEVVFETGKAFVKAKKTGKCKLTASYEGLPEQTVDVTVYAYMAKLTYYSVKSGRDLTVTGNMTIDYNDIMPKDGQTVLDFGRGDNGVVDLSKFKVESSAPDICSVSVQYFQTFKHWPQIVLSRGGSYGTADISLHYEEDIVCQYEFKVVNSPTSFSPGDQICNAETRKPLSGSGSIISSKGKTFTVQIGANGVKPAIWSSSHPEVAQIVPDNGTGLSICAVITTKEWGETVISANDEAGSGTLSFKLKVVPPPFSSNAEIVPYFSGNWDPVTETYGEIRDYSWTDGERNNFQVGYVSHDEFAVADRTTGKVYYAKWSYSVPGAASPTSTDYVTYLKFDFLQPASGEIIATDGYGTELRIPAEIRHSFKDRFLVRLNSDGTVDRNDLREAVQNKPFNFTWHPEDEGLTRTYKFAVCDAAGNMDSHFFNYANANYGNVTYKGDGKKVIVEISFPGEHKSNTLYVYSKQKYTKCIRNLQGQ